MPIISILSTIYQSVVGFVPPGLATCLAGAFVEDSKYVSTLARTIVVLVLAVQLASVALF